MSKNGKCKGPAIPNNKSNTPPRNLTVTAPKSKK